MSNLIRDGLQTRPYKGIAVQRPYLTGFARTAASAKQTSVDWQQAGKRSGMFGPQAVGTNLALLSLAS